MHMHAWMGWAHGQVIGCVMSQPSRDRLWGDMVKTKNIRGNDLDKLKCGNQATCDAHRMMPCVKHVCICTFVMLMAR